MSEPRPILELQDSGLLWLINRVCFHPRGFALAIHVNDDEHVTGWSVEGDGTDPWSFPVEGEREYFERAEQTLRDSAEGRR